MNCVIFVPSHMSVHEYVRFGTLIWSLSDLAFVFLCFFSRALMYKAERVLVSAYMCTSLPNQGKQTICSRKYTQAQVRAGKTLENATQEIEYQKGVIQAEGIGGFALPR